MRRVSSKTQAGSGTTPTQKTTTSGSRCCQLLHLTGPSPNLPYLSKLTERVVPTRFAEHSTTYNLLPVQQSAYRPFHSTETAIVSVSNDLVRSVDNGKVSLLILLDLSVAFDTVDHTLLLSVLVEQFSITSTVLSWFKSYLTDRTQSFVYAARQTPYFPIDCSVPQGSVLGQRCFRRGRSTRQTCSFVAFARQRHSVP